MNCVIFGGASFFREAIRYDRIKRIIAMQTGGDAICDANRIKRECNMMRRRISRDAKENGKMGKAIVAPLNRNNRIYFHENSPSVIGFNEFGDGQRECGMNKHAVDGGGRGWSGAVRGGGLGTQPKAFS